VAVQAQELRSADRQRLKPAEEHKRPGVGTVALASLSMIGVLKRP